MNKQIIDNNYIYDYKNGLSIWEIANKYNDSYKNTIEKVTGHRFEARLLSDDEKDKICKLYLDGISTVKIGEMYGVNNKPISVVLKEKEIEIDRRLSTRKYILNEHYFDEIDSPIKGYIYGLLLSDGSNNPTKQTVSISLQEEDVDILNRIREEIQSTKPLEYIDYSKKHDFGYHYKNQYRLLLFSNKICSALEKHGIVKNKSLIIEFPQFDDKIMPSLIRGMWDGDGTLGLYKTNVINVSLTATEMFCQGLKKYLFDKLNIESCHIYDASCHNGITKNFTIGKTVDKIKFLRWMYKDADIYLERKYKKYLQIMDFYNQNNINNSLSN